MSDDPTAPGPTPLEEALDQALDAFVYAPIGLLFEGPALYPSLVTRGRTQTKVARMMGEMAVKMGRDLASQRLERVEEQAREALRTVGCGTSGADTSEASSATPAATTQPATKRTGTKKGAATKRAGAKKARARSTASREAGTSRKTAAKSPATAPSSSASAVPPVAELAIPDYDNLSASQVVSRLRGLDRAELDAVAAYESATRGRKTILNRVIQLKKD